MLCTIPRQRRASTAMVASLLMLAPLSGCAVNADTGTSGDETFAAATTTSTAATTPAPIPGSTIDATPIADGEPELAEDYRIAVVVPDDTVETAALLDAARSFAEEHGAELIEAAAATADLEGVAAAVEEALAADPELVVGLGEGTVDALSVMTAERLDQQFLVIGGQLSEPTDNVTAVIWKDAATVTAAWGSDALAAGIDSVLNGQTGIVLSLAG